MSMATWKAKYYPEPAGITAERAGDRVRPLLKATIRKWQGLRPTVLRRHGLVKVQHGGYIAEKNRDGERPVEFAFGIDSCTLCQKFYDPQSGCERCPLVATAGCASCAVARDDDDDPRNPYLHWSVQGDPEWMIEALATALASTKE